MVAGGQYFTLVHAYDGLFAPLLLPSLYVVV